MVVGGRGEPIPRGESSTAGYSFNNLMEENEGSSLKSPIFKVYTPSSFHNNHYNHGMMGEGWVRWVVLFLSCWIMFGNYYAFDNPSALNRPLRGWLAPIQDEELFQYRLSLLYSLYSIPNVLLPFWVGRWLDRLGSRPILLLLSFLVTAGQLLVAFGIQNGSFAIIVVGRVLFGIGGESLAVAQSRLVTQWFEGKELALAIGLNLSIARIGTVVNNVLSPIIASNWSVPSAFWIGFFSCLLSFTCTIGTVLVDFCYRNSHTFGQCGGGGGRPRRHPQLSSRDSQFNVAFWLIVLLCFLFYGCMVPYNNVASDYLQTSRYFGNGKLVEANLAMSIPDTLAMFLIPALGIYVDRHGRKVNVILFGAGAFIFGHIVLALGRGWFLALTALIALGLAYSTLLSFWACIPTLIPSAYHSTAYGILTSSCNLAVTIISPLLVAPTISKDPSYQVCGLIFATLGLLAFLLAIFLATINKQGHLGLNQPIHTIHSLSVSVMGNIAPSLADSHDSGRSTPSAEEGLVVTVLSQSTF